MSDQDDGRWPISRRQAIVSTASIVTVGAASALSSDPGDGGVLRGGSMALDKDYKLADSERTLYQGPDSAKDAIDGQDGDRYEAVDTGLTYYWDGGWQSLGVGSSGNKAPASYFQSLTTEGLSIAGAVRSASDFDDETDGIDAAMRDASGPVTVLIPEGEGSGPSGEYVVGKKYGEDDVYVNQSDVPVGVKPDKDDVTFLGLGRPTITVDANNPCNVFLPSSYANVTGFYAGDQVENVNFQNLLFDGKGRDGCAIRFYESIDCSIENCKFTGWDPTDATFFGDRTIVMQHHADRIVARDCVFENTHSNETVVFVDGAWHVRFDNCKWVSGGGSANHFRQNFNGDFGEDLDGDGDDEVRMPHGTVISDCVFQQHTVSFGSGLVHVDNTQFRPTKFDDDTLGSVVTLFTRNDEEGQWPTNFTSCDFINSFLHFRNNDKLGGVKVKDCNIIWTRSQNSDWVDIQGGSTTNGLVYELHIKDNHFAQRADDFDGANAQRMRVLRARHGNVTGVRIEGNTFDVWRDILNDSSGGALDIKNDVFISRDNQGADDGLAGGNAAEWSENSGTEADAVAIGSGDSTGDVTVSVTHNLIDTPDPEDIRAFLSGASATDYTAYVKEIRNIGSTSFDVVVHIDSLAGTADETVDLSWEARCVPDWMKI